MADTIDQLKNELAVDFDVYLEQNYGTPPDPLPVPDTSTEIPEATLRFTYSMEELCEEVQLRTHYFGRNLDDKQGGQQLDSVAMTSDESDACRLFMTRGAHDVFEKISYLTKNIPYALIVDQVVTIDGVDEDFTDQIRFEILNHEDFNQNLIMVLEHNIRDAIVFYIMWQWYHMLGVEREMMKYEVFYQNALRILRSNSMLRKKAAKRPYRPMG